MLDVDSNEENEDSSENNSNLKIKENKNKKIKEERINTDINQKEKIALNNKKEMKKEDTLDKFNFLFQDSNYNVMKDSDSEEKEIIKNKEINNNINNNKNGEENSSNNEKMDKNDSYKDFFENSKDDPNELKTDENKENNEEQKSSYIEENIDNIKNNKEEQININSNNNKNLSDSKNNKKEDESFSDEKEKKNYIVNKDNNIDQENNEDNKENSKELKIYSDREDPSIDDNLKEKEKNRESKSLNNNSQLDNNISVVKNEEVKESNLEVLENKMIKKSLLNNSSNSNSNNDNNPYRNSSNSSSNDKKDSIKNQSLKKDLKNHEIVISNNNSKKQFFDSIKNIDTQNNNTNTINIKKSLIQDLNNVKINKSLSKSNNSNSDKDYTIPKNLSLDSDLSNSEDSSKSGKNEKIKKYNKKQLENNDEGKKINEIKNIKINENKAIINGNKNRKSPLEPIKAYISKNMKNKLSLESSFEMNSNNDEHYIKYIKLKRKGFQNIMDRNYISGFIMFNNCFEISRDNLHDIIKQIDSLINMAICEYYNGNFNNSLSLLKNGKKLFEEINVEKCKINITDKNYLGLKLFANSSMANLSMNNYNDSIYDIKKIIEIINKEKNVMKKRAYLKNVIFYLFKVDSLLHIPNENQIIRNIKSNAINYLNEEKKENNDNNYFFNKNEKIMIDFIICLKHRNYMILLNSFIENGSKYKKNNNLTGYYYCLFNQYIITYNNLINIDKTNPQGVENDLNELKNRLHICNKNLLGEELLSEIKNKEIKKFLEEFNEKMKTSSTILLLLEKVEIEINDKYDYEEKKNENNNNIKLDRNKIVSSSYLVKLSLMYSLYYLQKKKQMLENKIKDKKKENEEEDSDIQDDNLKNINKLIKELKKLIEKINNYEIDISSIKLRKIDNNIKKNLSLIFKNLLYIYHKSLLYRQFFKYKRRAEKTNLINHYQKIDTFLSSNYDAIIQGMNLIKINFSSKGYKASFYKIDTESNTLNSRNSQEQQYPTHSYNLFNDITKVIYGIKSHNLIKKILSKKDLDESAIHLMKFPWRILSFVTKKRTIDLYCDDEQLNNWFYGLKQFTNDNNISYKIFSTNKFVLNKVKYKIVLKLNKAIKNQKIEENNEYTHLIKQLCREVGIHNISFAKMIILYNKLINI